MVPLELLYFNQYFQAVYGGVFVNGDLCRRESGGLKSGKNNRCRIHVIQYIDFEKISSIICHTVNIFQPMMTKRKKRGRPPMPRGTSKAGRLILRMLPSEVTEIEDAAERAKETKSDWVRRVLLAAARANQ
jgi:hypothetical protein